MNLHKAKGLEADVVFLADPGSGPRQWADVHIERKDLRAQGWFKLVQTYSREDLRRLAMWLTVDEPQLRPVIDDAIDTVERAARADFWQLAQSHDHSVEMPFFVLESPGRLSTFFRPSPRTIADPDRDQMHHGGVTDPMELRYRMGASRTSSAEPSAVDDPDYVVNCAALLCDFLCDRRTPNTESAVSPHLVAEIRSIRSLDGFY